MIEINLATKISVVDYTAMPSVTYFVIINRFMLFLLGLHRLKSVFHIYYNCQKSNLMPCANGSWVE